jgi:hypothetical protein
MTEATWPLILTNGDSHILNGCDSSEELLDALFSGVEGEVANEEGCHLTVTTTTTWLVSTSSLSGELNPEGGSVESLSISLGKSGGSCIMSLEFDEGFAFSIEKLDLSESTKLLEHSSE